MYLLVLAVIWARGFLAELGFEQLAPTTIWTDSSSALLLATTFQLSSKSQHLTMRINAIHQEVINKVIVVTSQHVLYYCTYYSVSLTCTVHCTYCIYCTCFPVSQFEASSSTSVHSCLFTHVHTLLKHSQVHIHLA